MSAVKITSKGQITLRRELLDHLGLHPGQKLEATYLPGGRVELRPEDVKQDISALFGILAKPGQRPFTIEEINEGIAQGAVDSYLRSIGELVDKEDEAA